MYSELYTVAGSFQESLKSVIGTCKTKWHTELQIYIFWQYRNISLYQPLLYDTVSYRKYCIFIL